MLSANERECTQIKAKSLMLCSAPQAHKQENLRLFACICGQHAFSFWLR